MAKGKCLDCGKYDEYVGLGLCFSCWIKKYRCMVCVQPLINPFEVTEVMLYVTSSGRDKPFLCHVCKAAGNSALQQFGLDR